MKVCSAGGILFYQQPTYSPDGCLILVPCGCTIKAYSVETGLLVRTLDSHRSTVTCIRLYGDKYYSCSLAGQVIVFDLEMNVVAQHDTTMPLHQVLLFDENVLLLVSRMTTDDPKGEPDVQFCRAPSPKVCSFLYRYSLVDGHPSSLGQFNGRLFVELIGGQLLLGSRWQVQVAGLAGSQLTILSTHRITHPITCMAVGENQAAAVGDASGRIHVFHSHSDRPQLLHWHSSTVNVIAFLPSGYLVSAGKESVLVLWRISDQHKQFYPKIGGSLEQLAVRPDFGQFAVCTRGNRILLINSGSFRESVVICGLAGFGMGRRNIVERVRMFDKNVIVLRGAGGCLQAFDVVRDKSWFTLPVVELLVTDLSTTGPSSPDIETFCVAPDWIVTAEGRPGVQPHLGYIKMFNRSGPPTNPHTIVHRPHNGLISDICCGRVAGVYMVCSVSPADTFKLFTLQSVYDPTELKEREAWRVLYADPLNGRPSACALGCSGQLAISYHHKIVILKVDELVAGRAVRPEFSASFVLKPPRPSSKARAIKRLEWIDGSLLLAATDYDLFLLNTTTRQYSYWGVQVHEVAVGPDRIAVAAQNASEHWLLEFDCGLNVTGRRRLDGIGRAVVVDGPNTTCIHGDGNVAIFGAVAASDDVEMAQPSKKPRIITEALQVAATAGQSRASRQKAKPCHSKAHLFPLVPTQQLPLMSDIFRAFILPRIQH